MAVIANMVLKAFHRLLIGFVFILSLAAGMITLTGQSVYTILSLPTTYTGLIKEIQLAERGKGVLADFLVTYSISGGQLTTIEAIPLAAWEIAAETMLPQTWLEDNLLAAAQISIKWLTEEQSLLPDFTLDLIPIKTVLQGPQGILAVLPLLQSVPPCPPGIEAITYLGEAGIISCLPENRDLTEIAQLIANYAGDTLEVCKNLIPIELLKKIQITDPIFRSW